MLKLQWLKYAPDKYELYTFTPAVMKKY